MLNLLIRLLEKQVLGYKNSSEAYVNHMRGCGVEIGEGVTIFRPNKTVIDFQNGHLLHIGSYVQMTGPVTILTHDYSWSVLKRKYGEILGNQRYTYIGDNVFIGWGATILAGSHIGDNVVIGANSVVSGVVDSDSVYAGNPAKKICTLDEYYEKRKSRQLKEAVDFTLKYHQRFGKWPEEEKLNEYLFLFRNEIDGMPEKFKSQSNLMGNEEITLEHLKQQKKQFQNFGEFINYCETLQNSN